MADAGAKEETAGGGKAGTLESAAAAAVKPRDVKDKGSTAAEDGAAPEDAPEDAAKRPASPGDAGASDAKKPRREAAGTAIVPASLAGFTVEDGVGWPGRRPRAPPFMHGWFLQTHERVFDAVLDASVTTILELGSWYGASTEWLARACPKATVYAVDLWKDEFILDAQRDHYRTMGDRKLERMLDTHPLYDTFLANLWRHRGSVVPLRMDTVAGVKLLKDAGVAPDVVYVDADHHYAACKRDIEACLDAFPDALLVGDDYGHYDDVRNAVTESAVKYGKTVHVDANHCWCYRGLESVSGRNFTPKPKASTSFADLLRGYA